MQKIKVYLAVVAFGAMTAQAFVDSVIDKPQFQYWSVVAFLFGLVGIWQVARLAFELGILKRKLDPKLPNPKDG